jgi:hypothetical protein
MSDIAHSCERCGGPMAAIRILRDLALGIWTVYQLALCDECYQLLRALDRFAWQWFRKHAAKSKMDRCLALPIVFVLEQQIFKEAANRFSGVANLNLEHPQIRCRTVSKLRQGFRRNRRCAGTREVDDP